MRWLLPLTLLACTDGDTGLTKQWPILVVTPEVLEFGEATEDYTTGPGYLTITNAGRATLEVDSVELSGEGADAFSLDTSGFSLEGGGTTELEVYFTPPQQTTYTATVSFYGNIEEEVESVTVTGTGVEAPTPDVECDPLSIDFGTVPSGTTTFYTITCTNVGDGPLNVGDVTFQGGSGAFSADFTSLDHSTFAEGESAIVPVYYAPTNDAGDNASFAIETDDPAESEVIVTLLGNGGGEYDWPVAVIDCPATIEPRDTVTLDGSGSYDPGGNEPLTYEWTLTAVPEGSAITSDSMVLATETAYLQTDVAGEYVVTLQVTNSIDLSSVPTECVMDAIPTEQFHVELSWNTGSADLDLHLLQAGADFYATPEDCNWCNQSPDWGTALDPTDDPTLDIDDLYGYGPENINIEAPADGSYEVKVHYFDDNGDGDVTATVKIWLYGEEVGSYSSVMTRNDVWDVATIVWPDGTVLESSEPLYDAPERGCE